MKWKQIANRDDVEYLVLDNGIVFCSLVRTSMFADGTSMFKASGVGVINLGVEYIFNDSDKAKQHCEAIASSRFKD